MDQNGDQERQHTAQLNDVSKRDLVSEKDVNNINGSKNDRAASIGSRKQKRQQQIEKKQTANLDSLIEQKVSPIQQFREKCLKLAESPPVEIFMTVVTIYALYADDIRILAFDKAADPTFHDITFVCLVLFLTEFMVFTLVKPEYPLSFSFWMDIVSSVSLIFDIPWLTEDLFQIELESGGSSDLLKAGKVSRVTTRAAKLVRFIRLIRLMRVGKLYKHAFDALNERVEKYMDEQAQDDDYDYQEQGKLNDQIINKFDEKDNVHQQDKNDNDKDNDKKKKKQKKAQKPVEPPKQNGNGLQNSGGKKPTTMVAPINREYDERAKKFAFGKSKATIFINPDTVGMDHNSEDSDFGESRKKKNNQFIIEQEVEGDETKISKKLSDLTTKRVITLIFSVMISIPLFQRETYTEPNTSYQTGIYLFYMTSEYAPPGEGTTNPHLLSKYTNYFEDYVAIDENGGDRYPLYRVQVGFNEDYIKGPDYDEISDLRVTEWRVFSQEINIERSLDEKEAIGVLVSQKADMDLNAGLSLIRTTFLIGLLSAAAALFAKDSNELVLSPIERMLSKVKRIGANPLEAARMAEDEAVAEEELKQKKDNKEKDKKLMEKTFETSILETTIIQLGALLALGFGEAGSEIIAKNMNKDGAVNPMIPGRKIIAIFGFVAIRNFINATEALEGLVMIYANEIADIVHRVCDRHHGAANKNLGDCFLMVWKFKDDEFIRLNENDEVRVKNLKVVKNYADQAVVSFLKTMAVSKRMSNFGNIANLIETIKSKYENFQMNLGFGLHMGWGIEGAIGSEYKIDASYLSPNVNLASRLEYATKQYGVPILVSGQIYRLLSHKTQSYMRQVDRVTVKGSKQPMDLYTCDMDTNRLDKGQPPRPQKQNNKVTRVVARHKKQEKYLLIMKNKFQVSSYFEKDIDLIQMRSYYTPDFIDTFHEGLDLYLDGFWQEARIYLNKAQQKLQQEYIKWVPEGEIVDGPCKTLLKYMGDYKYKAPRTWKGYRSLTDK